MLYSIYRDFNIIGPCPYGQVLTINSWSDLNCAPSQCLLDESSTIGDHSLVGKQLIPTKNGNVTSWDRRDPVRVMTANLSCWVTTFTTASWSVWTWPILRRLISPWMKKTN